MVQRFECKEPGCDLEVQYVEEQITALVKGSKIGRRLVSALFKKKPLKECEEIAYLTCDNNHTHRYKVKVWRDKDD